ncbi:hypothetical protein OAR31_02815 [Candidatus Marinimicrobia bacterium]|nr:hypothetical protein [Candidatus Neomarinimicrobiota bacterium]
MFSEIIGKDRKAFFLVSFWWTLFDGPNTIQQIIKSYRFHQDKYHHHRILFLLNNLDESREFKKNAIPCKFIHQNALVDSNIFKPISISKTYDIIYNARLDSMKRHYLLKDCRNISLVSGYVMNIDRSKEEYLNELKKYIPHAFMINSNQPTSLENFNYEMGIQLLKSNEVNNAINSSKVGVILSAKEGACYASIEYLLAGIPVVSTKNIGGRDYFLDKRFCRIVSSNPKAIKNAVDELISLDISPNFIREETIKKMNHHLYKLKKLLRNILKMDKKNNSNFNTFWENNYINKMIKYSQPFPKSFIHDINF